MGEEIREDYDVATAATVTVDNATTINASATDNGDGGKIILWSDVATTTSAEILAFGSGDGTGGFIETSSAGTLSLPEGYVSAGQGGEWLLDPREIVVTTIDSPEDASGRERVSAATIEASLNSGTNVTLVSDEFTWVISDITKTAGGSATLRLGSAGRLDIDGDITSTAGELSVGLVSGSTLGLLPGDNLDDVPAGAITERAFDGQVSISGLIDTNGGNFGFSGAQLRIEDSGRIITGGGDVLLRFGNVPDFRQTGSAFLGCFSASGCFGDNSYVIDAGSGSITLNRNSDALRPDVDDYRIIVDNYALRTTGTLTVDGVRIQEIFSPFEDGSPDISFGSIDLRVILQDRKSVV